MDVEGNGQDRDLNLAERIGNNDGEFSYGGKFMSRDLPCPWSNITTE